MRVRTGTLAGALIAAAIVLVPVAARAACHRAVFDSESVSVSEGAGQVTLTVELQGGQPSCAGTVEYQTQNGTATAPQDYTARSGTLTFQENDDRRESISIPIINDSSDEPNQTFQVHIHNPTGGITDVGSPATVTITDNDNPPQTAPATTTPTPRRTQTRRPSTPAQVATPTPTPTRTAAPPVVTTPTPTIDGTSILAEPGTDDDDSNTGPLIGLVAGLLGLAAVGTLLYRRLRSP